MGLLRADSLLPNTGGGAGSSRALNANSFSTRTCLLKAAGGFAVKLSGEFKKAVTKQKWIVCLNKTFFFFQN